MKEQSDRRPRLVWAAMLAVDTVGNEHRLDRVRFVVAIQKLTQAPGEKRQQLGNFAVRDIPEPATQSKKLADARNTLRTDLRRWFQKEWLQVARELFQLIIDLRKPYGILARVLPKFCDGTLAVHPPGDDSTVRARDLHGRITGQHSQSKFRQLEISDHFRPQHAGDVGCCGRPDAGCDFLSNAAAANDFPAFEDKRSQSRAREIGRCGESIVPPADHNRIVNSLARSDHAHAMTNSHSMTVLRANTLAHSAEKLELNSELFFGIFP